jgi:hypothetical protein
MGEWTNASPEQVTLSERRLVNLAYRLDSEARAFRLSDARENARRCMRDILLYGDDMTVMVRDSLPRLERNSDYTPSPTLRWGMDRVVTTCKWMLDLLPELEARPSRSGFDPLHRELVGFNDIKGLFRHDLQLVAGQTVPDVELEGVYMGCYFIYLPLNSIMGPRPVVRCAPVNVQWENGGEHFHPHVTPDGYFCMGGHETEILDKIRDYRWDCEAILRTYNGASPYVQLHGNPCRDCGYSGDEDGIDCDRCGEHSCSDCHSYCELCDGRYCLGCGGSDSCGSCGEFACNACMYQCDRCCENLCRLCRDNSDGDMIRGMCNDCSEAEAQEQEQEATAS